MSDYGKITGLADRLESFRAKLCQPGSGLPYYGGLIADLEVVLRFLNASEFAEWLRVHGDSEQARFADEILAALDASDDYERLRGDLEEAVFEQTMGDYPDPLDAVEDIKRQAALSRRMRDVLEECGALVPGDTATDIPALLRALLS